MAINRTSSHGEWSSRTAFILAAAGSAVGLGNIWKFPYDLHVHLEYLYPHIFNMGPRPGPYAAPRWLFYITFPSTVLSVSGGRDA